MKKFKRNKPSKAYLQRQAELQARWAKRKPNLDELIADLEWLVRIRK